MIKLNRKLEKNILKLKIGMTMTIMIQLDDSNKTAMTLILSNASNLKTMLTWMSIMSLVMIKDII